MYLNIYSISEHIFYPDIIFYLNIMLFTLVYVLAEHIVYLSIYFTWIYEHIFYLLIYKRIFYLNVYFSYLNIAIKKQP